MRQHVSAFYGLTACLCLVPLSAVQASTNIGAAGAIQFSATITARSCDVKFDETTQLAFNTLPPSAPAVGSTLQLLSYGFDVSCNYSGTPKLTVTGNTPYTGNTRVFLDANAAFPAGGGNGFGVMVRPATTAAEVTTAPTLSSFYADGMGGKALSQGTAASIVPLATANSNTAKQLLWLGLVAPQSDKIVYGSFKSTLTLTVDLP